MSRYTILIIVIAIVCAAIYMLLHPLLCKLVRWIGRRYERYYLRMDKEPKKKKKK